MNSSSQLPWPGAIDARAAAGNQPRRSELRYADGALYLLEREPQNNGATVLLRVDEAGVATKLLPGFSVRSRVHEYGGGSYCVGGGAVYFVEEGSQQLYVFDGAEPRALTDSPGDRFGEPLLDASRRRLICVRERHRDEVVNELVCVQLDSGKVQTLVSGHDFVASPRVSPDGASLAYLSWEHPHMPWQRNQLWVAALAGEGLAQPVAVGGGGDVSHAQPLWRADSALYYLSDAVGGWWNLWLYEQGASRALAPVEADLCRAQWELGASSVVQDARGVVWALASRRGQERLLRLDESTACWREVEQSQTQMQQLCAAGEGVCFLGAAPRSGVGVYHCGGEVSTRLAPPAIELPCDAISVAESLDFDTPNGAHGQAFFYPPCNPRISTSAGAPPLLVIMHGGPTSACGNAFNPQIQFWTGRGFAVLDVNYRGSTGFGRAYRLALAQQWGIADVEDCVEAVRALVEAGRVDPARVVIRGGSAGGFTALAAAVRSDVFAAVGCHYGVADLALLARDTHKFESHYLEHLIGAYPAQADRYRERSPVHHLDRIDCPVFVSHGELDQVVPVNQAHAVVEALSRRGRSVELLLFDDERHGYIKCVNLAQLLERELAFYLRVFDSGA